VKTIMLQSKLFSFGNTRFFALTAIAISFAFATNTVDAHEPNGAIVYAQAIELNCAADDFRDEIKTHFRGTKCYGKMLSTAARIRSRSAAVKRRTGRNSCYRGMNRDVCKLEKLVCELNKLYETTMQNNLRGVNRKCVAGETVHVAEKLAALTELADCMKAASKGLVGVATTQTIHTLSPVSPPQPVPTLIFPEYDPNFDIAPPVTPPTQNQIEGKRIESYRVEPGQLDHNQGTTLPSPTPTLNGPTPVYRSVIER
jgi:hypothetical protein